MLHLRRLLTPRGIFSSVVRRLEMFHIHHATVIITDEVQLGGQFSPGLLGPTPTGLIPNHVATQPIQPPWPSADELKYQLPGVRIDGAFGNAASTAAHWSNPV